jgi:hypothetical protein
VELEGAPQEHAGRVALERVVLLAGEEQDHDAAGELLADRGVRVPPRAAGEVEHDRVPARVELARLVVRTLELDHPVLVGEQGPQRDGETGVPREQHDPPSDTASHQRSPPLPPPAPRLVRP